MTEDDSTGTPDPDAIVPTPTRTTVAKDAADSIPDRIGKYHIKRVIATGGMGTVYEAVQEQPRRHVALKVMKHGITSRSALVSSA